MAPTTETPAAQPHAELLLERLVAPVRFAWRTDADGCFSAISPEFTAVVGENAADIVGRRFSDMSTTLELDPSSEIAGLLQRRDTWSGRSVSWPVAITNQRIPVDLEALPVYGRGRTFEGFRGFSVAHPGKAVIDDRRMSLALIPNSHHSDEQAALLTDIEIGEVIAEFVPAAVVEKLVVEAIGQAITPAPIIAESIVDKSTAATDESGVTGAENVTLSYPFSSEVPVLEVDPSGDHQHFDKLISCAKQHQETSGPVNSKGLSQIERSAFRKIGEKMKIASEVVATRQAAAGYVDQQTQKNGEAASTKISDYSEVAAAELTEHVAARQRHQEMATVTDMTEKATTSESCRISDLQARRASELETVDGVPVERTKPEKPKICAEYFIPSLAGGRYTLVDESLLEQLLLPVLIHAGDVLHYANTEFLQLTGYSSVEELVEADGLDVLFAASYGDAVGDNRNMYLRTRGGNEFQIEAMLRSVPWHGGKALMQVIRRISDDDEAARCERAGD